jgi:hypothetical protein
MNPDMGSCADGNESFGVSKMLGEFLDSMIVTFQRSGVVNTEKQMKITSINIRDLLFTVRLP